MAEFDEKEAKEAINSSLGDLPESPASANVKIWIEGFGTMITIRDKEVGVVLERLYEVIKYAKKKGWSHTWDKVVAKPTGIDEAADKGKEFRPVESPKTKTCQHCGGTRTLRTGVTKGKKWAAWFCETKTCEPDWVRTNSK